VTDLVHVWIVSVDVSAEDAARCWEVLDDGERARAGVFRHDRDRRRFTVAHGALRILAARVLAARPSELSWIPGPHGKPELALPWSGLHTSLSHSGDLIATAISPARPVGVDVQQLTPSADAVALAARYFPADEATFVADGRDDGERAERFTGLWARKEAVVKAAGTRLWPNLTIAVRDRPVVSCVQPPSSHRVVDVAAPDGYRAAVALTGSAPFGLRAFDWPNPETATTMAS